MIQSDIKSMFNYVDSLKFKRNPVLREIYMSPSIELDKVDLQLIHLRSGTKMYFSGSYKSFDKIV